MTKKTVTTVTSLNNETRWVALVGNPNSGKTALFNLLTGLNQKVSNYPGVTVERKVGTCRLSDGGVFQILDLPGTYSITPESYDERIVAEQVLSWIHGKDRPNLIISVVDASNLSRNLYLTTQLTDLGIPVIIALNMMDVAKKEVRNLDVRQVKELLGVSEIIPISATKKWGIDALKQAIETTTQGPVQTQDGIAVKLSANQRHSLEPVTLFLKEKFNYSDRLAWAQSLRLITRESVMDLYRTSDLDGTILTNEEIDELTVIRKRTVADLMQQGVSSRTLEATLRYQWLDEQLKKAALEINRHIDEISSSEKIDRILTHRWLGPLIFIGLLYFIFQSIFTWATVPMEWIERGVSYLNQAVINSLAPGVLRDLLVEGVITGVGAIMVFLPQILILVFFLSLMEDFGYMSRVAFMLDKFMVRVGLHGRSVLPLMSGYACAIPGIMATRTIDSWKERLITILILPLMSCSARLPVYTLMIGAFIPNTKVFGFFNLQGITLVFLYFLGTATAMIVAKILSKFIRIKGQSSFVMELPPYRLPMLRSVLHQVYIRGKIFILNAGKIIMAISIVLWFLASYPKVDKQDEHENTIHNSYAGRIGRVLEPIIKPLGFDWKIGIGLITSFAAREVLVSTMATIYSVAEEGDEVVNLTVRLQNDIDPETGQVRYSPLVALSLMVFFVYAAQCMATFAIVRNETNSWKWPLFMIVYLTTLAYIGSLFIYQGGKLLGFA